MISTRRRRRRAEHVRRCHAFEFYEGPLVEVKKTSALQVPLKTYNLKPDHNVLPPARRGMIISFTTG